MALTDSLVAYWSLDEASGTRSDSHGANDLTDNNTVTAEAAKQSNGALFVAANSEYLSIADNAALSGSDRDFMLCGWVLLNSYPGATFGIIGKGTGVSNASGEYYLRYNHGSTAFQWRCFTGSASATLSDPTPAPALETWYFIELWHDSTNNQIGIRVNRGVGDTTPFAGPVANTTGAFRMGQDPSGANHFDGVMDEWGFWDRILTSAELDELYNSGAGVSYADIAGGGGPETYTGTGVATLPGLTGGASGTFTAPIYTGTGAASLPSLAASGSATHEAPVYTGSGSVTLPGLAGSGSGSFATVAYTGTGAITLPGVTGSGSGTFEAGTFTGSGAAELPTLEATGAGTFSPPIYTGEGAIVLPALSGSGAGIFATEVYSGTGSITLPGLTGSGAGTFTEPVTYTGSGAAILPMFTISGAGTFGLIIPTFEVSAPVAIRQSASQEVELRQSVSSPVAIRQSASAEVEL